jgi:hypothetical protein
MRIFKFEIKNMFYLSMLIILTSCYNKQKPLEYKSEYCIIDSVYKRERSSLEIDNKYILETNCGKVGTKDIYKKGDTIKIYKYE